MLSSFAQLETIKNSVISGIPNYILHRKIREIKQQYFPEEVLAESLKKESSANEANRNAESFLNQIDIRAEKPNEHSGIDSENNNDENNNNNNNINYIGNKDLSFSKNKGIDDAGSISTETRKATNGKFIL